MDSLRGRGSKMKCSLSKPEVTIKVIELVRKKPVLNDQSLKPLSHQTAMPQRLYSVLNTCQHAVGSPRNTPKILNLPLTACTQRIYSVPSASTRRSHGVFIASMTLLRRAISCCSVFSARSRHAHSAHTALSRRS